MLITFFFQPCTGHAGAQALPKLLQDAPDPDYVFEDIAWARERTLPTSMARRCIEGIRARDEIKILEGVINLFSVNLTDNEGRVPLVSTK
jgi:hypothetical protein